MVTVTIMDHWSFDVESIFCHSTQVWN